jgi:hypothetical protein
MRLSGDITGQTVSRAQVSESLVRLGQLDFDDFRLLPADAVRHVLADMATRDDWRLALNNTPHILVHFRRFCPGFSFAIGHASLAEIESAQSRLVLRHAPLLLREKCPPLYDILPWHDWDFSIVTRRFPLWKTRFLLAGDGTTVVLPRCRKSAGVFVFEPSTTLARYIQRKAELERVKRFRPIPASLPLSLPDASTDLAIIGSMPQLNAEEWNLVAREALRVARDVLVIENNPLAPALPDNRLSGLVFRPNTVRVTGLGLRRCWWLLRQGQTRR